MSLTTFNTNYLKGSYSDDVTFLLKIAENAPLAMGTNTSGLHPHIDGKQNLAIGYGYDFAANGTTQSIDDLIAAGATITDEAALRLALDNLTAGHATAAQQAAISSWVSLPNQDAASALLAIAIQHRDRPINPVDVQKSFQTFLQNNGIDLPDSRERAVLMSMWYQLPGGGSAAHPGKNGYFMNNTGGLSNMSKALIEGNRAEVWYQIRYQSSNNGTDGAMRRFAEAEMFGLYNDPANVPPDEAKQVYRMLQLHRDTIMTYESNFGSQITAANVNYQLAGTDQVDTLVEALNPAKLTILADLANNTNPDIANAYAAWEAAGNSAATFLSTNLYLDPGRGNAVDARQYTVPGVMGSEIASNDIVIGESGVNVSAGDMLIGGMGDDLLIGGTGNDYLFGGEGNDIMAGGAGDDTYFLQAGDGIDTIEDKVGNNRIIFNDKAIGSFYRLTDGLTYMSYDGGFSAVLQNGDFIVTDLVTGDKVTLNKNFQSGDFGITLTDAPVATQPTLTIVGDLAPLDQDPASSGIQLSYDSLHNVITDPSVAEPGRTDILYGSADGDRIAGLLGMDILDGKEGDDQLEGGGGRDNLTGGAGNDILQGGDPVNLALITDFHNFGGATADGSYGDFLTAGIGNDILIGSAQSDALMGGEGDDLLVGGAGHDVIFGDASYQTPGNDWTVRGLSQAYQAADETSPGWGNGIGLGPVTGLLDTGIGGRDLLYGGSGGDWIMAGRGDDIVYGESGMDSIDGGAGNDILYGGEDDDAITGDINASDLNEHGNDYIDLGSGTSHQAAWGNGGNDVILGGNTDDTIEGDDLRGLSVAADYHGADYIDGKGGNDTIWGEGGADFIYGGDGNDTLYGDVGTQYIAAAYQGDDTLDGGAGNDTIYGDGGADVIHGGSGNDLLFGDAPDVDAVAHGDDTIYGDDGDDELQGGGGNDILEGGAGADNLFGQEGNDTLIGGAGADYLDGGAGDDIYLNVTSLDTISDNEGNDTIVLEGADSLAATQALALSGTSNLTITLDTGETLNLQNAFFGSNFNLQFGNGEQIDLETQIGNTLTTALNLGLGNTGGRLYGGAGADRLYGGTGNDALSGALGNDSLYGGGGNDALRGGDGDDFLQGESGDDTLEGGSGADYLLGGAGNDTYFLDGAAGGDIIIDAEGNNIIRLTGNLATTLTASIYDSGNNPTLSLSADGVEIASLIGGLDSYRFAFDDGSQLSLDQFLFNYRTDPLTVQGDDNDNTLYGGQADDTLYGYGGNDTLDGGRGNDILDGGAGNDSYIFSTTSGHDIISWQNDEAIGDRIVFAAGIQYTDLSISGLANGDLLISINNQDASLTLTGWFNNASHPSQFQFADGTVISPEDIAAWRIPPITGTDGDDLLTGSDYDDVILGNAGNDTLNGGGGNDTLEGGAGRDSYVLQLGGSRVGNGLDTVIETGGETSVIKLQNADMGDLLSQRSGNDLVLSLLGSGGEGLLLKDYYTHVGDWTVVNYSGTEQPLADVLADNESRRAGMDRIALLEEAFAADWRAALLKNGRDLIGATQLADGRFELKPVVDFNYYKTQLTNLLGDVTSQYEQGSLSYKPWSFTSLSRQTINSSDAEISLNGWDTIQENYSSTLMDMTLDNSMPTIGSNKYETYFPGHYVYGSELITLPPGMNGFNTHGYSVYPSNVPGQYWLTGSGYVPAFKIGYSQVTSIEGHAQVLSISPSVGMMSTDAIDLGHAILNQQPPLLTQELWRHDQNITLTTLNAGDNDNYIDVASCPGLSYVVHAGGGNDIVNFGEGIGEGFSFFDNLDIMHPGIFMDGGAGDDTLIASSNWSNDVLIGGTGRNYLKGFGGADRYILSATGGLDLIDSSNDYYNQSVDTVELPDGITRNMLTTTFGQAIVQGQVQSTLNLNWNGKDHALIMLPSVDYLHGVVNSIDHVSIKFTDGSSVALDELIADTPVTDNAAYYNGNIRVAVATSSCNLTGQGLDNVFVVQGSGITNVTTGEGRNFLQGFNAQSQVNAMLMAGSETWLHNGGAAAAQLQVSGTADAQLHIQTEQYVLENSVLYRDGQDLVLQDVSNDLYNPWNRELRFTDWFTETSQHQVEFEMSFFDQNSNEYRYGHFSLQAWVDQFAAQSSGVISDGSSVAIGSLNWNVAEVPMTWGGYNPVAVGAWTWDDIPWQMPLTRVMFTAGMGNVSTENYDAVAFDNAIASADVRYIKSGNDLLVTLASGTDSLRLQDWYLRTDKPEAWFADGEVQLYSDLSAQGITLTGTDGNDSLVAADDYGWTLQGLAGNDVLQGNAGADYLEGGEGNDTLTGGIGDDHLDGGAGNDTLSGGAGNDYYQFGAGSGDDLIQENDSTIGNTDVLAIAAGIDSSQIWFRHIGDDLEMSIIGTADKTTVKDWYIGQAQHIEQFTTADGKTLLDSQVDVLVSAMAAFAPPTAGQTTLPVDYQSTLAPVIAANWQ